MAAWKTSVQPDGLEHINGRYIIDFQVWRRQVPSNSCYTLVGYDRYRGSLGLNGLVSKVSKPSNRISFRKGDVAGILIIRGYNFSSHTKTPKRGGIKLDTSYTDETVWYRSNLIHSPLRSSTKESCPMSLGKGKKLDNFVRAAPLLSVQTGNLNVVYLLFLANSYSKIKFLLSSQLPLLRVQ